MVYLKNNIVNMCQKCMAFTTITTGARASYSFVLKSGYAIYRITDDFVVHWPSKSSVIRYWTRYLYCAIQLHTKLIKCVCKSGNKAQIPAAFESGMLWLVLLVFRYIVNLLYRSIYMPIKHTGNWCTHQWSVLSELLFTCLSWNASIMVMEASSALVSKTIILGSIWPSK